MSWALPDCKLGVGSSYLRLIFPPPLLMLACGHVTWLIQEDQNSIECAVTTVQKSSHAVPAAQLEPSQIGLVDPAGKACMHHLCGKELSFCSVFIQPLHPGALVHARALRGWGNIDNTNHPIAIQGGPPPLQYLETHHPREAGCEIPEPLCKVRAFF